MTDANTELWLALWEAAEESGRRVGVGVDWPSCPACGDGKALSFSTDRLAGRNVRAGVACGACGWELPRPAPPTGGAWLVEEVLVGDAARRLGDEEVVRRLEEVVPERSFSSLASQHLSVFHLAELVRTAVLAVDEVFALGASLRGLVRRLDDLELRLDRLERRTR